MSDKYVVDQDGTKIVKGSFKILPSGSESEEYLQQRALEEQERLDQELLDSLIPSKDEMLMAEVEINTITILMEVGLI